MLFTRDDANNVEADILRALLVVDNAEGRVLVSDNETVVQISQFVFEHISFIAANAEERNKRTSIPDWYTSSSATAMFYTLFLCAALTIVRPTQRTIIQCGFRLGVGENGFMVRNLSHQFVKEHILQHVLDRVPSFARFIHLESMPIDAAMEVYSCQKLETITKLPQCIRHLAPYSTVSRRVYSMFEYAVMVSITIDYIQSIEHSFGDDFAREIISVLMRSPVKIQVKVSLANMCPGGTKPSKDMLVRMSAMRSALFHLPRKMYTIVLDARPVVGYGSLGPIKANVPEAYVEAVKTHVNADIIMHSEKPHPVRYPAITIDPFYAWIVNHRT